MKFQEESEGEDYEGAGEDSDEDLDEEEDDGEEVEEEGNLTVTWLLQVMFINLPCHVYLESPARGKKRKMEDWFNRLSNRSISLLKFLRKKVLNNLQKKKKLKKREMPWSEFVWMYPPFDWLLVLDLLKFMCRGWHVKPTRKVNYDRDAVQLSVLILMLCTL